MNLMEMINLPIEFFKRMVVVNTPGIIFVVVLLVVVRVVTGKRDIWRRIFDKVGRL